jgi:hypothetical protein
VAGGPYSVLVTLATIAAATEDDLTTGRDVVERVMEVSAGLSTGDGSLAAGAEERTGPVAGALSSADGDQYGCAQIGFAGILLLHGAAPARAPSQLTFHMPDCPKRRNAFLPTDKSSFKCHTRSETKGLRITAAPSARLATSDASLTTPNHAFAAVPL